MKPNYKIINHKRRYLCDYDGTCINLAYKEVYPKLLIPFNDKRRNEVGWCYLCRKHFKQEQKRLKNKLPYCDV